MKILTQKREGNRVSFEIEETFERFQKSHDKSMAAAGQEIRIAGFRPGKAPKNILEKSLNLDAVAARAAQDLIAELNPKEIEAGKLDPVNYPSVDIVQPAAKDKPFVFKLTVEVYPEVKLGKYKGLKLEKKEGDDAGLKDQAVAAASAEAKVDIPSAMVEREINVMLDELRVSLGQSGLTLEDYLRGAKKEEKTLRDEMKKSAEIRVKGKVILRAVGEAEKLKVSDEEIQAEVKAMGAAEEKIGPEVKKYVEEYLLRKKALDLLIEKASVKFLDRARNKEEKKS